MDKSDKPKTIKITRPNVANNYNIVLPHLLVKDGNWFDNTITRPYVWLLTICFHLIILFFVSIIPTIDFKKPEPIPVSIIIPEIPKEEPPKPIVPPKLEPIKPEPVKKEIIKPLETKPILEKQIESKLIIEQEIVPKPKIITPPIIQTKKLTIPKIEKLENLPEVQEPIIIEKNRVYDVKLKNKKLAPTKLEDLSKLRQVEEYIEPTPKPRQVFDVKTKAINKPVTKNNINLDNYAMPSSQELEKQRLEAEKNAAIEAQRRAEQERALQEAQAKDAAAKDALLRESLAKNLPKAATGLPPATSPNGGAAAPSGASGSSAPSAVTALGGAPSGAPSTPSSGTGTLPRQPKIYAPQNSGNLFETGENNSLLARMRRTAECTKVGEERDPRCPRFVAPQNNRNSIAVPLPNGVTPRNNAKIDPLPPCPPNTPHSNFGVICMGSSTLKKNQ